MKNLHVLGLLTGTLWIVCCVAGTAQGSEVDVNLGDIVTTDVGKARGYDISGRVMIVRHDDGSTEAFSQVMGLNPHTTYASHVHDLPCGVNDGGGHYKIDPSVSGTVQSNEIWLNFTTDADGVGHGLGYANHTARPEAQSIVVHDPLDGARIACADIKSNKDGATVHSGTLYSLSGAGGIDISGVAQLVRANGKTRATLFVEGLASQTAYPAHVHMLPCGVLSGGGHYKIDPTVAGTLPANEIWLNFMTDASGEGKSDAAAAGHIARPEAQSVVVHAPDGTRIACADLMPSKKEDNPTTQGETLTTPIGVERGYDITGKAKMTRQKNGKTSAKIKVKGLDSFTTYPTHVHNRPCCENDGGGHYKIDPSVPGTVQSNEIWPTIHSNHRGVGVGETEVHHTARPEAQSIVIHDPSDGARIGCADIE